MARIDRYRLIVRQTIEENGSYKPSNVQIDHEIVIDSQRDHYEVMHIGWEVHRRIHGSIVHLEIRNRKVWIQYDGTSRSIADRLVEAGIPREDIVLGIHPAEFRLHTDFAFG